MIKFILLAMTSAFLIVGCSSKSTSTPAAKTTAKADKTAKKASQAAKGAAAAAAGAITCKNGSDVRTLEVLSESGGCKLAYTKFNETNNIASAASGVDYCDTVSKRIQTNLAGSGFTCN